MRISEISIRRPVFATVMSLMIVLIGLVSFDRLSVRVGSVGYAEENGTYGATTLRHHHLRLTCRGMSLRFPGKGGVAEGSCLRNLFSR